MTLQWLGTMILATGVAMSFGHTASAQAPAPDSAGTKQGNVMTTDQISPASTHISGSFDVKLVPQTSTDDASEATPGRMTIDKTFHGDLQATSKGQMLALMTEVKGSAGYVAMERVTGSLKGRSGSFALQHTGTMNRGVPQLSVTVVPDSGTGELVGLAGKMTIDIVEGKHLYTFDYTLQPAK